MAEYVGAPIGPIDTEAVAQVELGAGRLYTSDPELFLAWIAAARASTGEGTLEQRTAVALSAADSGCPTPGNAYIKRAGVESSQPAWLRTVVDYREWVMSWNALLVALEHDRQMNPERAAVQERKISILTGFIERKPGTFVSPDWPVEKHQAYYQEGLSGVVNYVSFPIAAILRDGMREWPDFESGRAFFLDLINEIVEIDDIDDDLALLLQVADAAVELWASRDMVMGRILSKGYLIAENGLTGVYERIQSGIQSGKYPHLKEDAETTARDIFLINYCERTAVTVSDYIGTVYESQKSTLSSSEFSGADISGFLYSIGYSLRGLDRANHNLQLRGTLAHDYQRKGNIDYVAEIRLSQIINVLCDTAEEAIRNEPRSSLPDIFELQKRIIAALRELSTTVRNDTVTLALQNTARVNNALDVTGVYEHN